MIYEGKKGRACCSGLEGVLTSPDAYIFGCEVTGESRDCFLPRGPSVPQTSRQHACSHRLHPILLALCPYGIYLFPFLCFRGPQSPASVCTPAYPRGLAGNQQCQCIYIESL